MAAVGAGDVVVLAQGFADTDGDCFLADVEVGDARHAGAGVEVVGRFLEGANLDHLLIGLEPVFGVQIR